MKFLFIPLIISGLAFNLAAQETVDIFTFQGRYGLPQSYEDTYPEKATEYGTLTTLTAGFNLSEKSMIGFNVNHFYFNVQGDPAIPGGIANPVILHGFIIRAGLIQNLGNGRKIQLLAVPRLMSDLKNLDRNSLQMGAVITYDKKFHDELTMGFGVMYNQELFGPYLVPLFNLNWQVSSKWNISGLVPITSRFTYKVNDNFSAGFGHFGMSTSFYLGEEAYAGDYIDRLSVDASLFARQRLFGPLFLEGTVGRSFARGYKQYAGDEKVKFAIPLVTFGDNRTLKSVKFNDGIILQLKLVINIVRPE